MYLVVSFVLAYIVVRTQSLTAQISLAVLTLVILVKLLLIPQTNKPRHGHYTAPLVPLLPAIGIFCNFVLAVKLDALTWGIFGIFAVAGLFIYFGYSINSSKLELDNIARGHLEVSINSSVVKPSSNWKVRQS